METKRIWSLDIIDKNEMIKFIRDRVIGETTLHGHDFMEIEYVEKGTIVQNINGKEYFGQEGDFFVFYKGDVHSYVAENQAVIVNLIFYSELYDEIFWQDYCLKDKCKLKNMVKLCDEEKEKVINIFNMMEEEIIQKKEHYMFVVRQYLHVVITYLLRSGKSENAVFNKQITEIMQFVDDNISNVTVSFVADKFGYQPHSLSKVFKKNIGITPMEYIERKKVIEAIRLLLQTDSSIESIAMSLNFYNKTHFYNIFKRYTNRLPGDIRKTEKKKVECVVDEINKLN